jgi:hypothetical protein
MRASVPVHTAGFGHSESDRAKVNVVRYPSKKDPIYSINTDESLSDGFPEQGHVWN